MAHRAGTRRNQLSRRIEDRHRINHLASNDNRGDSSKRIRFPLALPKVLNCPRILRRREEWTPQGPACGDRELERPSPKVSPKYLRTNVPDESSSNASWSLVRECQQSALLSGSGQPLSRDALGCLGSGVLEPPRFSRPVARAAARLRPFRSFGWCDA